MTTRSGRGRWQRVLQAREQARSALGQGPASGDPYGAPKRKKSPAAAQMPYLSAERLSERPDESVAVLSLGEAAARLGIGRSELEALISAGKVRALPTGFTTMIPTREVERLTTGRP